MALDRNREVRSLHEADMHIGKAEAAVTRQQAVLDELRRAEHDTVEAERLLGNFEDTLAAMVEHRRIIVSTIAQIDAGQM